MEGLCLIISFHHDYQWLDSSLFTLTFFAKMCYVGFGNKTKDWDDQISQIIKWRRWLEGQAYIELLSFAEVLSRKNILFATPDANNLCWCC